MPEEKGVGGGRGTPVSNTLLSDNINLPDDSQSMVCFPEKLEGPKIPHFREKPVQHLIDGFSLYFKKINDYEYWICEQQNSGSYFVQWIEFSVSKPQKFHRKLSNRFGLDVENKKRDQALIKHLNAKAGIESDEIKEFLEEVGVFIGENRVLLSPMQEEVEENPDFELVNDDQTEEISEEQREKLIEILKKPDLLSFIDKALYERSPDDGFIIGEVESKHILNFNCVGARLGLSTINTLKGGSSIGKTNTANVVTGLHRTKKVGSLSDTALKYADDLDHIDILYIQETLEEEFKNKETRLMSADDGGFIAETTVKNPKTGQFEVQQTTIPVKTLVTTTTAIELDPEFASRNFIIPVDDSEEQTKRILEENFKSTEKKLQEIKGEINFNSKYKLLSESYKILLPYTVLIPFEKDLMDIFPTSNPRARRDSKKLMQLIKESALLFQYQRCSWELNEKPILVASWADLAHAILLGGPILEATLTGFDKRLIEALPIIYEIIDDKGFVTTKSLHEKLKKSSKYAWQILNFFEDNGYIYHDSDTKRSCGIKGKTKVYIKTGAREYKSLLLAIGNIDWLKIKKREEKFLEEQIPNSSHQVSEEIYLPHYDPSVPNKVVYHQTSIHSEKFRIYQNEDRKKDKKSENNGEILKGENRIIKQAVNTEIDYRNLSVIEKTILTELAGYSKHTLDSLIEALKSNFRKADIVETVRDMEVKGWLM
jgi:Mn-dependent DtxR family transcriptional regulator